MESRLYLEKKTGFYLRRDADLIPTSIFQPTPEGVTMLCKHYSRKYSIDLRCVDLRDSVISGADIKYFFEHLQLNPALIDIAEGESRGLILSHGQFHVIPLMIAKKNDIKYMFVFDSSSGSRIKGYFQISNYVSDFQFYLNSGTRQADEGSCMTDAICILKEALMVPDIIELIKSKQIAEHTAFKSGRFFTSPKPGNFFLFKMPERLLLTAQITRYLEQAEADLSVTLRGGKSLQAYRDDFLLPVVLDSSLERAITPINGYLYRKSEEHKSILDSYSAKLSFDAFDNFEINQVLPISAEDRISMNNSPYPKVV